MLIKKTAERTLNCDCCNRIIGKGISYNLVKFSGWHYLYHPECNINSIIESFKS